MKRILNYLIILFLFLLPWQTRYIFRYGSIGGGYSEYGTVSLYGTEILLVVILLFVILTRQLTGQDLSSFKKIFLDWSKFWWALWAGAVGQGIFAIWQFFTQNISANKWLGLAAHLPGDGGASVIEISGERWLRAYGSFGSPNSLGIYLAVILILGLVFYLKTEKWFYKIIITVGQIFILTGFILSWSRGAWIAAVSGMIALALLVYKKKTKDFFRQIFYYALTMIFFITILPALFFGRFNFANRLESQSMGERMAQYSDWVQIFSNNWFTGFGPGNYVSALTPLHPTWQSWQFQPVHNIYLLALAEYGIVGWVLIALLVGYLVHKIYRRNREFVPIIIVLFVAGLFDHWLASMWTGIAFFWLILAYLSLWIDSGQTVDNNN